MVIKSFLTRIIDLHVAAVNNTIDGHISKDEMKC